MSDVFISQTIISCYHSDMWTYLEHLSVLLENIGIALRAIPDSQHQRLRERLSIRTRSTSQLTKRKAVRTTSRSIEYVTTDGGELNPGQHIECHTVCVMLYWKWIVAILVTWITYQILSFWCGNCYCSCVKHTPPYTHNTATSCRSAAVLCGWCSATATSIL